MEKTNYLVTGGAGFIGSHLVDNLVASSDASRIFVIDDLSTGSEKNLPKDPRVELIRHDVCDSAFIRDFLAKQELQYVVHLAADASVQNSVERPGAAHRLNFDATLTFLESLRGSRSLKSFVYSSSASVYGDKPTLPSRETDAVSPISPYGIDKYSSERYVLAYHRLFGLPGTAFRFFNVFGPRQNSASPYTGVISIFFNLLMKGNRKLTVYGDGKQTRDFVFVKDVVNAIRIGMASEKARGKVFNVGTGKKTSLLMMIAVLEKIFGSRIETDFRDARNGDIRHSVASIDSLKTLGYRPAYTLEDGLREYKNHLDGVS